MPQTETLTDTSSLGASAAKAAQLFAAGIAGMFDIPAECVAAKPVTRSIRDLRDSCRQPAALACINSQTSFARYYLAFDRDCLFVLSGIFLMLPEPMICEKLAGGTRKDAIQSRAAIGEISDFITRVWSRAVQEQTGHDPRLAQQKLYIGDVWTKDGPPQGNRASFACVDCSLTIKPFPNVSFSIVMQLEDDAGTDAPEPDTDLPDEAPPQAIAAPLARPPRSMPATADLRIADAMTRTIIWADENDTVEQLATRLAVADFKYALVGTPEKLDGIVSRCDLRAAISPYLRPALAKWRRQQDIASLQIRIRWAMTAPVRISSPDITLLQAFEDMNAHSIGAMPIADENGVICGLLTRETILQALLIRQK